jgi:hypothetical protein
MLRGCLNRRAADMAIDAGCLQGHAADMAIMPFDVKITLVTHEEVATPWGQLGAVIC